MNVTFDFRSERDCADASTILNAFGYAHELITTGHLPRIKLRYDANAFGQIAGEVAVFAPVQITVE